MPSFFTRHGRAIVALAIVALNACADASNPTAVRMPGTPSLAVGDVILVTNTSGAVTSPSFEYAL